MQLLNRLNETFLPILGKKVFLYKGNLASDKNKV